MSQYSTTLGKKSRSVKDIKTANTVEKRYIIHRVNKYGVIVLGNQSLNDLQLEKVCLEIGGQAFQNPEDIDLNRTGAKKLITRITNIREDQEGQEYTIDNDTFGESYHQDGDFWADQKNNVWNFLYCVESPGLEFGQTKFLDTRRCYEQMSQDLKDKCKYFRIKVDMNEISDFQKIGGGKFEQAPVYHDFLHFHLGTQKHLIYFGSEHAELLLKPEYAKDETALKIDPVQFKKDVMDILKQEENSYTHCWKNGDLLIWDNTSSMHKAAGGHGSRRRHLLRGQVFMARIEDHNPEVLSDDLRGTLAGIEKDKNNTTNLGFQTLSFHEFLQQMSLKKIAHKE